MSPNINDVFPTKYLKAHDLKGHEPVVTIERVEFEPVGRTREMKPVVYFAGKEKGIVLNKTNANKIIEISGSGMTEEWPGTAVKLYTAEADYGGESYDVVRIKSPNGKSRIHMTPAAPPPKPKPAPAHALTPDPELETDIYPFDDADIPF
jgi:hypothetical protein